MHSRKEDRFNGLRVFIVIFNVILLPIGATMIGVGVWLIEDKVGILGLSNIDTDGEYNSSDVPGLLKTAILFSAILGGFLILESSFACVSLCQMTKRSLVTTCVTFCLIIIAHIAIILMLATHRVIISKHLHSSLHKALATEYNGFIGSQFQFSQDFDKAQVQFGCCGIDNHTDFMKVALKWPDKTSLKIPKACCKLDHDKFVYEDQYEFLETTDCARKPTIEKSNISMSCYESIKDWLSRASLLCLLIGSVAIVIEILTLVLTITLTRKVDVYKKAKRRYGEQETYRSPYRSPVRF